jgi:hypothetical protein
MTKNNQESKKMKQTDFEQRSIRNAEEVNLLSDFHAWQYARKQEEIKKLKRKDLIAPRLPGN